MVMTGATDAAARAASAVLAATVLIGAVPAGPAPVALQPVVAPSPGSQPPALPQATGGCVGESPVVASTTPWALSRMAPQDVWPLTRGDGVVVAVLDTGVSSMASGLSGGVVRPGTDVVSPGPADRDCFGRGTALAGIVAARPVSGSAFVGIAPGATVLPVRIVDSQGKIPPGAIAKGIRAATTAGANVILLGVGTAAPDSDLKAAVKQAVERDIVIVAAVSDQKPSGNGQSAPALYPASDDQVLAVGGVGADGVPTETSPPEAGVDLLAPGAGAVSVGPSGPGHYSVSGPAVAAAYVAGAAVLVRAYHPELKQAEVRRRLELTAEHPLGAQHLPAVGYGTLDLYAAVSALDIQESPLPAHRPQPVTLPTPAAPPPPRRAAGPPAAGTVAAAALAYVSAILIRWGRRRRWRP
jgi:type VII secretion-associated serine protease mycosin